MASKLTPELIEKAKQAKSPEELMALAKENGAEMTEESAKACFAKLNPKTGELADDELDQVAGGCGEDNPKRMRDWRDTCEHYLCANCYNKDPSCSLSPICYNCKHASRRSETTVKCCWIDSDINIWNVIC